MAKRKKDRSKINRRDFLKAAGLSAAGLSMAGMLACAPKQPSETPPPSTVTAPPVTVTATPKPAAIIKELPAPGQRKVATKDFTCDVLVVGAGYAGTMAAVKAASMGQKVIVVNKQITGKAGFSPWANTMMFYDETLGDKREDWIQAFQSRTEYLVNLDYLDVFMNDSLARWKDWDAFGILNQNYSLPTPEQLIQYSSGNITKDADRRWWWPRIFKDRNIPVVERVMLTNLLTNSTGAVVGAAGFHMESDEILTFRAKAVVMCTGQGAYKSCGFPVNGSTFDGDAMAYRAGAKIGGKSWEDFHGAGGLYPSDSWDTGWRYNYTGRIYATVPPKYSPSTGGQGFPALHKDGNRVARPPATPYTYKPVDLTKWENVRYDNDANHPPFEPPTIGPQDPWQVGGGATGLGIHCAEGIWPVDVACWSGIPGLYAAGDALCSRLCGTAYSGKGTSSSSAGVFGYRAGEAAAKYAAGASAPVVSADQISSIQNDILAPRKLTKGYDPRWVQEVLLSTMAPYYILKMKHKTRLQGALENVLFLRDNLVPKAMAADPHELRLCHEDRNMVLNAEMKLRTSLAREESRGTHFREDFPYRDDKNWLAWQTCQMDSKGNMVVQKEPVPDRMKTNKDMPYTKRYNLSFPGEQEAITKLGIT